MPEMLHIIIIFII